VEGRSRGTARGNHPHNGIEVAEHIASGDPQNTKAGSFEIALAEHIDAALGASLMRLTVNLNKMPS
jgi:hypothetical protein